MKNKLNLFWERCKEELRISWPLIWPTVLVGALLLVMAYVAQEAFKIPPGHLTRDVAQIVHLPFYTGIFSNLGIMLWSATAACAFIGAVLLWRANPKKARFLLASGVFTAWLGFDDMIQLHEEFMPKTLHIPEEAVFAFYILIAAGYLLYYLRVIYQETDFLLLGVALAFMGTSVLVDTFMDHVFLEDGAKFMGIIFWVAYYSRTAVQQINRESQAIPASEWLSPVVNLKRV